MIFLAYGEAFSLDSGLLMGDPKSCYFHTFLALRLGGETPGKRPLEKKG
jgi:hypothetical protein